MVLEWKAMSHWNYRIIKDPKTKRYGIHEVFYFDDDKRLWTEKPIKFLFEADSVQEMLDDLKWIKLAFKKPIMSFKSVGKGRYKYIELKEKVKSCKR